MASAVATPQAETARVAPAYAVLALADDSGSYYCLILGFGCRPSTPRRAGHPSAYAVLSLAVWVTTEMPGAVSLRPALTPGRCSIRYLFSSDYSDHSILRRTSRAECASGVLGLSRFVCMKRAPFAVLRVRADVMCLPMFPLITLASEHGCFSSSFLSGGYPERD